MDLVYHANVIDDYIELLTERKTMMNAAFYRCFLCAGIALTSAGVVQAEDHAGHSLPVVASEPPAQLLVDEPVPGLLSRGVVVLPVHAEHIKILPVYGEAAVQVKPRIGHYHVTVDKASWHWVHSSDEPVVIQGLGSGIHHVRIELAEPNHHVLAVRELDVTLP
jgi:hypothetical protein